MQWQWSCAELLQRLMGHDGQELNLDNFKRLVRMLGTSRESSKLPSECNKGMNTVLLIWIEPGGIVLKVKVSRESDRNASDCFH